MGRLGMGRSPIWLSITLMLIVVEIVWRVRSGRGYDARTAFATIGVALGGAALAVVNGGVIGIAYGWAWSHALVRWPLHDWRSWLIAFVAVEFAYYWFHRASHRIAWMWATHSVHHTPEQMTLLSSIRLGWTNLLSGGWIFYLPLVLLGFDPRLVIGLLAFDLRYQFFLHTEAIGRLGPLEWILNTPAHHRVHHGSNIPYLDRNYGGVVIVFDRMFGTFASERVDEPIRYGLVGGSPSRNPFGIALGGWRTMIGNIFRAPTASGKVRTLLGLPGAPAR